MDKAPEKVITIKDIFGVNAPKNVFNTTKAALRYSADPSLLFGLELEVEHASFDDATNGFTATEDGSLRHNGVEFISHPMNYSNVHWALSRFFERNGYSAPNYSERCSIHVHANCQDMTLTQLASLILIYQVFEGVLFTWIDSSPEQPHNRRSNIFCVPLAETQVNHAITGQFADGSVVGLRKWHKYTALNLLPLETLGTVEFRHMGGEWDVERITTWCRLISCMFAKAKALPFDEVKKLFTELNTTSEYDSVLDLVFMSDAPVLRSPTYQSELENGVLNMKYSLLDLPKKKKTNFDNWFANNPAQMDPVEIEQLLSRVQAEQGDDRWNEPFPPDFETQQPPVNLAPPRREQRFVLNTRNT